MRVATKEEILKLTEDEMLELHEKSKLAPLLIDNETFQPYKEIDGVRYYIEEVMDTRAFGNSWQ